MITPAALNETHRSPSVRVATRLTVPEVKFLVASPQEPPARADTCSRAALPETR